MKISFFLFVLFFISDFVYSMPAQIIIMRHGEKPIDNASNELSPRGWQRAQALPLLFTTRPELKLFGPPVALFAMSPEKKDGSIRAIQTLKYVAEEFGLSINKNFTRDQVKDLVKEIKHNSDYDGKMIIICWEHKVLLKIAEKLDVTQTLDWPSEQFDRIWVLNYSKKGKLKEFQDLPERLLESDSTN